jgi:glucose-1-phosphate adenylyltransferase
MNFAEMLATHTKSGADVTIAAVPVSSSQAKSFGIMRLDDSGRVVGFLEKPQIEPDLALVRTAPAWIDAWGIPSRGRDCLASMGIYVFNRDSLTDALTKTDYHDFGREIFPALIRSRHVQVHLFDGYWEDIGTIRSYYDANLALAGQSPPFEMASAEAPIYTSTRFLPPSRLDSATIRGSLLADGCFVESGAVIENSVIGVRCRIGRNVTIKNSILLGVDEYQMPSEIAADRAAGRPPIGVGDNTVIDGAIIDKNCRIGRDVRIVNRQNLASSPETPEAMIVDGIVVVPKDATLADGWSL